MKLILIRHGQAAANSFDGKDRNRELTALGQQQAHWLAGQVLNLYQPDTFFVSPYVRAGQTLAPFSVLRPQLTIQTLPELTPDAPADEALETLSYFDSQCALVVCHMNLIAYMHQWLLGTTADPFATAEARVYDFEILRQGKATLEQTICSPQNITI